MAYRLGVLDQWYVNGPLGLEQGFTLKRRPLTDGGGPLTLSLPLPHGQVKTTLDEDHHGLALVLPGAAGLRYAGLMASDAAGRAVPARLAVGPHSLQIKVRDAGARYPIRIDPVVQTAKLTASDGAAFDRLGASVAVSADGSTIVAGAPGHDVAKGAVYVFARGASGWSDGTEVAVLTASDGVGGSNGVAGDNLGSSVAISADGSTVASGAYLATVATNSRQGAVYVFTRPQNGWTSEQESAKLTAAVAMGGTDNFMGFSVGMSGDGSIIAAGAPQAKLDNNNHHGIVWVFTEPNGGWSGNVGATAGLTASDQPDNGQLGSSLAVSTAGFNIAAGAPFAKVGSNGAQGEVYVYSIPAILGGTPDWSHGISQAHLTASDGGLNDLLGNSIAMTNGGTIAASSSRAAAYVFERTGLLSTWGNGTEKAKLTASDGASGSLGGGSVTMSGDASTIVVGGLAPSTGNRGAYEFVRPGLDWAPETETATMVASDGTSTDEFGSAVNLSSDGLTTVAGAPIATVGGAQHRGALYVFPEPTGVTASCDPAAVTVGQSSTCKATVRSLSGTSTPTGTVRFTSNSPGSFSDSGACTLLSEKTSGTASCQLDYRPSKVATAAHILTADYAGDPTHAPSRGSATVGVTPAATAVAVSCRPSPVRVGRTSTCTASVTDVGTIDGTPTGHISFSAGSKGLFRDGSCTLKPAGPPSTAVCAVRYTPLVVGSGQRKIAAHYGGDADHLGSAGTGALRVRPAATSTSVHCSPLSVAVGHRATCTATVTDRTSGQVTPAGEVSFKTKGAGSFPGRRACKLRPRRTRGVSSCHVTYRPARPGSGIRRITAIYRGGPGHSRSHGSTLVAVTR